MSRQFIILVLGYHLVSLVRHHIQCPIFLLTIAKFTFLGFWKQNFTL